MGKPYKSQHWIPQKYLERWTTPNPFHRNGAPGVWVYDRTGTIPKHRPPGNIFEETDMYTEIGADGERILRLEHDLGKIETAFGVVRKRYVEQQAPLSEAAEFILLSFIAAMFARSQGLRDKLRDFWGEIAKIGQSIMDNMAKKTPEERKRIAELQLPPSSGRSHSFHPEELAALADRPMPHALWPMIKDQLEIMRKMSLAILWTDDPVGFITSDKPVVWADPTTEEERRDSIFNAVGIGHEGIEITLPISPQYMALVTWHPNVWGYQYAPPCLVDELNRRTRQHANKHFVANIENPKSIWYAPTPMQLDELAELAQQQRDQAEREGRCIPIVTKRTSKS